MLDSDRQAIVDDENIKLLSLGYMISAGVSGFFSLFALMYVGMGLFIGTAITKFPNSGSATDQPPPAFIGWILGGAGLALFVVIAGFGALKLLIAFRIKQRKSRTLCLIIAGGGCLGVPYGTVLGVFMFIVLGRGSVIRQFDQTAGTQNG